MGKKKKNGGGGGGGAAQQDDSAVAAAAPASVADQGNGGGKPKKDSAPASIASDGTLTVVLKVDMHCEGCAKKVAKSVRGFDGVETVRAEAATGELTVVGKVNPWRVWERVEEKTHKKVDLVSPTSFPKNLAANNSGDPKKPKEKDKPVVAGTTVTLKIRLHCDGCIRRIRKSILSIKGVESVTVDVEKDSVTVKGTMDAKALPELVKNKVRKEVEVMAQPKKDSSGGAGGGEKKDKGCGADSKKDGGGEEAKKDQKAPKPQNGAAAETSKDYCTPQGYRMDMEMVYAPQLFSDENPNACSVM